ncbi:hypothetical protein [Lysobacter sp. GCM10012299]|uniref:hypothetical protein n=1 Tax=Lysobacter sp. GCM10012299 TaxID=3317333 RepID=UPI0036179E45
MIWIDFSIFYADSSYGHANGTVDLPVPCGTGAIINLLDIAAQPPPTSFSGQLVVDHILEAEGGCGQSYGCGDIWVASEAEALALGRWLDKLPGLAVWPNDSNDPALR